MAVWLAFENSWLYNRRLEIDLIWKKKKRLNQEMVLC